MHAVGIEVPYVLYNNVGALSYKLAELAIGDISYFGREPLSDGTILREEYFSEIEKFTNEEGLKDLRELEHMFTHAKYTLTYLLQAERCYTYALALAKRCLPIGSLEYKISESSIMINSALLKRSAGMMQSAYNICQQLLHKYPAYVDSRFDTVPL